VVPFAGFSNQEANVKLSLDKFAANAGVGIDGVLLPSEKVIEIKNGKGSNRVKKVYPGSVFVRMKSYNEEKIVAIAVVCCKQFAGHAEFCRRRLACFVAEGRGCANFG
jgi:transcriptional antiterminator NusG